MTEHKHVNRAPFPAASPLLADRWQSQDYVGHLERLRALGAGSPGFLGKTDSQEPLAWTLRHLRSTSPKGRWLAEVRNKEVQRENARLVAKLTEIAHSDLSMAASPQGGLLASSPPFRSTFIVTPPGYKLGPGQVPVIDHRNPHFPGSLRSHKAFTSADHPVWDNVGVHQRLQAAANSAVFTHRADGLSTSPGRSRIKHSADPVTIPTTGSYTAITSPTSPAGAQFGSVRQGHYGSPGHVTTESSGRAMTAEGSEVPSSAAAWAGDPHPSTAPAPRPYVSLEAYAAPSPEPSTAAPALWAARPARPHTTMDESSSGRLPAMHGTAPPRKHAWEPQGLPPPSLRSRSPPGYLRSTYTMAGVPGADPAEQMLLEALLAKGQAILAEESSAHAAEEHEQYSGPPLSSPQPDQAAGKLPQLSGTGPAPTVAEEPSIDAEPKQLSPLEALAQARGVTLLLPLHLTRAATAPTSPHSAETPSRGRGRFAWLSSGAGSPTARATNATYGGVPIWHSNTHPAQPRSRSPSPDPHSPSATSPPHLDAARAAVHTQAGVRPSRSDVAVMHHTHKGVPPPSFGLDGVSPAGGLRAIPSQSSVTSSALPALPSSSSVGPSVENSAMSIGRKQHAAAARQFSKRPGSRDGRDDHAVVTHMLEGLGATTPGSSARPTETDFADDSSFGGPVTPVHAGKHLQHPHHQHQYSQVGRHSIGARSHLAPAPQKGKAPHRHERGSTPPTAAQTKAGGQEQRSRSAGKKGAGAFTQGPAAAGAVGPAPVEPTVAAQASQGGSAAGDTAPAVPALPAPVAAAVPEDTPADTPVDFASPEEQSASTTDAHEQYLAATEPDEPEQGVDTPALAESEEHAVDTAAGALHDQTEEAGEAAPQDAAISGPAAVPEAEEHLAAQLSEEVAPASCGAAPGEDHVTESVGVVAGHMSGEISEAVTGQEVAEDRAYAVGQTGMEDARSQDAIQGAVAEPADQSSAGQWDQATMPAEDAQSSAAQEQAQGSSQEQADTHQPLPLPHVPDPALAQADQDRQETLPGGHSTSRVRLDAPQANPSAPASPARSRAASRRRSMVTYEKMDGVDGPIGDTMAGQLMLNVAKTDALLGGALAVLGPTNPSHIQEAMVQQQNIFQRRKERKKSRLQMDSRGPSLAGFSDGMGLEGEASAASGFAVGGSRANSRFGTSHLGAEASLPSIGEKYAPGMDTEAEAEEMEPAAGYDPTADTTPGHADDHHHRGMHLPAALVAAEPQGTAELQQGTLVEGVQEDLQLGQGRDPEGDVSGAPPQHTHATMEPGAGSQAAVDEAQSGQGASGAAQGFEQQGFGAQPEQSQADDVAAAEEQLFVAEQVAPQDDSALVVSAEAAGPDLQSAGGSTGLPVEDALQLPEGLEAQSGTDMAGQQGDAQQALAAELLPPGHYTDEAIEPVVSAPDVPTEDITPEPAVSDSVPADVQQPPALDAQDLAAEGAADMGRGADESQLAFEQQQETQPSDSQEQAQPEQQLGEPPAADMPDAQADISQPPDAEPVSGLGSDGGAAGSAEAPAIDTELGVVSHEQDVPAAECHVPEVHVKSDVDDQVHGGEPAPETDNRPLATGHELSADAGDVTADGVIAVEHTEQPVEPVHHDALESVESHQQPEVPLAAETAQPEAHHAAFAADDPAPVIAVDPTVDLAEAEQLVTRQHQQVSMAEAEALVAGGHTQEDPTTHDTKLKMAYSQALTGFEDVLTQEDVAALEGMLPEDLQEPAPVVPVHHLPPDTHADTATAPEPNAAAKAPATPQQQGPLEAEPGQKPEPVQQEAPLAEAPPAEVPPAAPAPAAEVTPEAPPAETKRQESFDSQALSGFEDELENTKFVDEDW